MKCRTSWWGFAVSIVTIHLLNAGPSLRSYNTPWTLRPCKKLLCPRLPKNTLNILFKLTVGPLATQPPTDSLNHTIYICCGSLSQMRAHTLTAKPTSTHKPLKPHHLPTSIDQPYFVPLFKDFQSSLYCLIYFSVRLTMWCQIIERAYTKEVIRTFLEACAKDNRKPNLDGFLLWIRHQVKNIFMIFVLKIVWVHMFAAEVFRKGCRLNNLHFRVAGEKRMEVVLFQDRHRFYQQAVLERDSSRLTMNPAIRRYYLLQK